MNKHGPVVVLIFVCTMLLSSCIFYFGEGEFTVVDVSDLNPAWVSIEVPTSEPTFSTNDNSIYLSGLAFVSETYMHCCPWDSGVGVISINNSNGETGYCSFYTDGGFLMVTRWEALIPLIIGENNITITAYEYLAPPSGGYSRSKTITIIRI